MSSSTNSSLARKNAIKSKQGSWFYRLKLSLKKMISKFKFYSFKVSTKEQLVLKDQEQYKVYEEEEEEERIHNQKISKE